MSKKLLFRNGEEYEKVIQNPHADRDHHQRFTTSRGSPLAHACQVWSTSVSAFVSYPAHRMIQWQTEWQNDHVTSALLAHVITRFDNQIVGRRRNHNNAAKIVSGPSLAQIHNIYASEWHHNHKKPSCRREAARRSGSLKILLSLTVTQGSSNYTVE